MKASRMNPHQEQLQAAREKLVQEVASLQSRLDGARERLAGLDTALAILAGDLIANDQSGETRGTRRPRGSVKDTVLRLLQQNAVAGLTAADVVDLAKAQQIALDRNSVSSLLSKLKSAGTLELIDGNRYIPAPIRQTSPGLFREVVSPKVAA